MGKPRVAERSSLVDWRGLLPVADDAAGAARALLRRLAGARSVEINKTCFRDFCKKIVIFFGIGL